MTNFFYEISKKIYNMRTPPQIKNRRHGRPRQQHNHQSCQGCHLGLCHNRSTTSHSNPLENKSSTKELHGSYETKNDSTSTSTISKPISEIKKTESPSNNN